MGSSSHGTLIVASAVFGHLVTKGTLPPRRGPCVPLIPAFGTAPCTKRLEPRLHRHLEPCGHRHGAHPLAATHRPSRCCIWPTLSAATSHRRSAQPRSGRQWPCGAWVVTDGRNHCSGQVVEGVT